MQTKAWWRSRVVWVNVATFFTMALALSEVTVLIPKVAIPYVTGVSALLNLALRFGTDVKLGSRDN